MPLAGDVIITVDGGAVFRVWSDTYGTTADEVFVGRNPVGATTCATMFHGRIEHVQWLH
jgi:hypothetical protein